MKDKTLSLLFSILLSLVLISRAEGGIKTLDWKIKFDVVNINKPTRVHVRADCTVNPDLQGADSSGFLLRGLGDIEDLVVYDPVTNKELEYNYIHQEGIVYFGMKKTSPYTFTIECDAVNNLISTPTGERFYWDTSGWPEGSTVKISFTLPQYVDDYSLDGVKDYDLIEEAGRRILNFKGDAKGFSWLIQLKKRTPEDRIGPLVEIISMTPNPTRGAPSVILEARADDTNTGNSDIASIEYFIGDDPGIGHGIMMESIDGKFDSPVEIVKKRIDVLPLKAGEYPIKLRARDKSDNWGEIVSSSLNVSSKPFSFSYIVYFDTAKVDLKREAKVILDKAAELIMKYPDLSIRIEGHTDSRPIHTKRFSSNYELSIDRARSVLKYLHRKYGIDLPISIVGYAAKRPIATNKTKEGMAKNRRVELIIYREE